MINNIKKEEKNIQEVARLHSFYSYIDIASDKRGYPHIILFVDMALLISTHNKWFSSRNKENIITFWMTKAPYLVL